MSRALWASLLLVVLACVACGDNHPPPAAPQPTPTPAPVATDPLDAPLPLDKRVTKGKLENGLTYYVLPHHKPEKRAQVWLAVNAGSTLEDEDQRGLAHFCEHMAFNGTKRFPKAAIVDFVEKSGVRFGADLNAYTSFDETVYQLQVPTDRPELLNTAFTVLRDWAGDVSFDPQEVEKERGVVLEEWRLGRGAGSRLFDKQAPIVFNNSKYAERLPIGLPEIIKNAPRDTLYKFYKDWYRPDLMAVIAVGDFDVATVEAKIKSEFGSLQNLQKERPRTVATVPPHAKTLVTIETDPEMPVTSVGVLTEMPHRAEKTGRDYRRTLGEQVFNAMLNGRLDEVRRQQDAPFLRGGASASSIVRSMDAFSQQALVKEDQVQQGYTALLEELLRVERHGFTPTELERVRASILRSYQQIVSEYETQPSRSLVTEIVRNFLQEEAMAGPEAELALAQRFLPAYTVADLNQIGKELQTGSRVVTVSGPPKMLKPTAEALLATTKTVETSDIRPYDDGKDNGPLLPQAQMPTPVTVAKTTTIPELDVTEWTLPNGLKVVVKPTKFRNDEVRLSAFSPGGTSLAKDADFDTAARFASAVVREGGVGSFDAVALRKSLTGKIVSVGPNIGELEESFGGAAAPADMETMFQLVYLYFTAPRKDAGAFATWQTREAEQTKNRRLSPEATFFDDMQAFQNQNHPRFHPVTPEMIQKVSLDKAFAFYKDRFADADDFTFVLVGNIDLEKTKSLVETYLGSLPTKHRKETWRDVNVSFPPGVATKTVTKGTEPKSSVILTFHGADKWTRDGENDMKMLSEVLGMRLREVLREDMGGVYGVSVSGALLRRPKQEFTLSVRFGCAPENVDKLVKAVFDEAKAIQEKGIGEDYIGKVKEIRKRTHETSLKDNGFWSGQLESAYFYGDDPKTILDSGADKISADRVKAAAKRYVTPKSYVEGVLKPVP